MRSSSAKARLLGLRVDRAEFDVRGRRRGGHGWPTMQSRPTGPGAPNSTTCAGKSARRRRATTQKSQYSPNRTWVAESCHQGGQTIVAILTPPILFDTLFNDGPGQQRWVGRRGCSQRLHPVRACWGSKPKGATTMPQFMLSPGSSCLNTSARIR